MILPDNLNGQFIVGRNKMDSPEEPIGQVMYTSCRTKKPLTRPSSGNQYLSIEKGKWYILTYKTYGVSMTKTEKKSHITPRLS